MNHRTSGSRRFKKVQEGGSSALARHDAVYRDRRGGGGPGRAPGGGRGRGGPGGAAAGACPVAPARSGRHSVTGTTPGGISSRPETRERTSVRERSVIGFGVV